MNLSEALVDVTHARDVLERIIQMGCIKYEVARLADVHPKKRHEALKYLDSLGAFEFRYAVVRVAEEFGISRVTVYNAIRP
jgi:predicted transcriptional regulator YheO